MSEVLVLGIAQDAGFPHIGCTAPPCSLLRQSGKKERVACLGLIDSSHRFLIDATPDLPSQLETLLTFNTLNDHRASLSGILLTHAHIGHYTGLMYLGREALNAKQVPVYCTPPMASFIRSNAPWSQLVSLKNIVLHELQIGVRCALSDHLSITPLGIPHRNEFADTVGYIVHGQQHNLLYIPDIDSWDAWSTPLATAVRQVNYALLDGTFSSLAELPAAARHSEVPHPPVSCTVSMLEQDLDLARRVWFIHLNHTNPLLFDENARSEITKKRFNIANDGTKFTLL